METFSSWVVWLWWLWILLAGHEWFVFWGMIADRTDSPALKLPRWRSGLFDTIAILVLVSAVILTLAALLTTLIVFCKGIASL